MRTAIRSARNTPTDPDPLYADGAEQGLQTPLPFGGGCKPNIAWHNLLEDQV